MFFITKDFLIIADDSDFSLRTLARMRSRKIHQGETMAKFLYNFMAEFMNRDTVILENYEKELLELEDSVLNGDIERDFQNILMPVRKQLLVLRSYYDQLSDLGKYLEEDENRFFGRKQVKYFGAITDTAERLMGKTIYLIDYARQVKELYQSTADGQQNKNMQFLTVLSALFFPLTLITGWYGMNFANMPELESGYTYVKILSAIVIVVCLLIYKKKKIL